MGIKNAFIDPISHPQDPSRADFSGMNNVRSLYISKAIHQTFVDVDERGTEAAAATGITMRVGAAPGPRPEPGVFRADHPFLFLIRDDATSSILFLGRLADPPAPSSPAGK
jgi:serpin B